MLKPIDIVINYFIFNVTAVSSSKTFKFSDYRPYKLK